MSPPLPFVTVLMPIRDEAAFIDRSLGAVLDQDYPRERLEILVLDGMSTDGTRQRVRQMIADRPGARLIDNPAHIVPVALNLGLRAARGEVLVRVDGHCVVAPDYVRRCVEHLRAEGAECVGGPIQTVTSTPKAEAIAIAMGTRFGVGGSSFRTVQDRRLEVGSVPFPAYTRDAVARVGAYDEELVRNEDDDYNYRLRRLGGRVLMLPDIRSRYFSRSTLVGVARQYFQYGYWKVRVLQKSPRQMRPRQLLPPALVLALLAGAAATPWTAGRLALAGVFGGYLLANLTAATVTARRTGWRRLPLLAAVFATLHLSYGSGFLVGLGRFWNRWLDRTGRTPALDLATGPGASP